MTDPAKHVVIAGSDDKLSEEEKAERLGEDDDGIQRQTTDDMPLSERLPRRVSHAVQNIEDAAEKRGLRFMTHDDLLHEEEIIHELPMAVRLLGICLAFLAIVCTWEVLDHLVVKSFPHSGMQITAYLFIMIVSLIGILLSKAMVQRDYNDSGTFALSISSLAAAMAAWGLAESIVRVYWEKDSRFAVWLAGSMIFLSSSFLYTCVTKHTALLDIASCAHSIGFLEEDCQEPIKQSGESYNAC